MSLFNGFSFQKRGRRAIHSKHCGEVVHSQWYTTVHIAIQSTPSIQLSYTGDIGSFTRGSGPFSRMITAGQKAQYPFGKEHNSIIPSILHSCISMSTYVFPWFIFAHFYGLCGDDRHRKYAKRNHRYGRNGTKTKDNETRSTPNTFW